MKSFGYGDRKLPSGLLHYTSPELPVNTPVSWTEPGNIPIVQTDNTLV